MENDNVKFKNNFHLPNDDSLIQTDLKDVPIGFSVLKKHSKGYASLIKLCVYESELKKDNPLKSISISASYGKEVENGISMSSSGRKRNIREPIDLKSDDFFYNIETKEFFHKQKSITADELLTQIYQLHIKPTKTFRGLWLRMKLVFWQIIVSSIAEYVSNFFVLFLRLISKTKISTDIWNRVVFPDRINEEFNQPDLKITQDNKPIKVFGYEIPLRAIIFYSVLHLLIYIIFFIFDFKPRFIIVIFTNIFLTMIYVYSSLWIVEYVMPRLLKILIIKTTRLFHSVSLKEIKI